MKSVSVASIGLAWIKGSFELMCFEGILFFITGDFIADTFWNSDWLMLVLRTISMALIAAQVGYLAGVSANRDELVNGACSALLTSLWLIVVFLHDRWSMSSELYLVMSLAMPLFGALGGLFARRTNWSKFELPKVSNRPQS